MIFSSSIAFVSFALSAHSFLIPGNLDAFAKDGVNPTTHSQEQSIDLDCSTCPFALSGKEGVEWTQDVQSDLPMKFKTDGQSLELNDVAFYPVNLELPPPQLHVSQKKKEGEDPTFEGYNGDLRLSYSLEYDEQQADDGNRLVTVTMTVMALDGQFVRIDDIKIKTIKDSEGNVRSHPSVLLTFMLTDNQLILHSVETITPPSDAADAKCNNVLCRVFTKILTSINKAKAKVKSTCYNIKCMCVKCFKTLTGALKHVHHKKPADAIPPPPPAGRPTEDDMVKIPMPIKVIPSTFKGHQHMVHHHKHFFHRMGHVMLSTLKIAFMPIFIGIAFGMAASAIGMLVGQALVCLWAKYRKTEQVVYLPVDVDEKSGLPAYEDLAPEEVPLAKDEENVA